MNTILEVLNKGADYLAKRDVEDSRRVMELLLGHLLHCDRLALYMRHEDILSEEQLTPLREQMKKKAEGVPLQHLMGFTEFFGRPFRSDSRALIPRPETEELVDLVLKKLPQKKNIRLLDMGTGSGIIGITLALELKERAEVTLVDVSEQALSLALENAMSHKVKVNALRGDLFSAFADKDEPPVFDAIIANLPYIATSEAPGLSPEVRRDPALALFGGTKGDEIIMRFLEQAPMYLSHDGFIALEIGWNQADDVLTKMQDIGYSHAEVLPDIAGIRRFPLGFSPSF